MKGALHDRALEILLRDAIVFPDGDRSTPRGRMNMNDGDEVRGAASTGLKETQSLRNQVCG